MNDPFRRVIYEPSKQVRADRPPGVIIRSGGVYLKGGVSISGNTLSHITRNLGTVFVKINLIITHAAKTWHHFRHSAERSRTVNFVLTFDQTGLSFVSS